MARVNKQILQQQGQSSSRRWFLLLDRINTAKRELQGASNPNLQLLWESLLMDWQVITPAK